MARRTLERSRRRSEDLDDEPRDERDEEQDDEPPRRRGVSRRSRDDDDGDDVPRRRTSRSRRDDDDEDDRPRRRRSRRDDDDEPKRGTTTLGGRGWGGYDTVKSVGGSYNRPWTLPDDPTIVKIMDEEPFANYAEHWVTLSEGKRSFTCLGDNCPLCDAGVQRQSATCFNILVFENPEKPTLEFWKVSKTVAATLKTFSENKATSPLNREDLYFEVFKTKGRGGNSRTSIQKVKARDLLEDYDIDPLTDEELEDFESKMFEEEDVTYVRTRSELRDIANDLD